MEILGLSVLDKCGFRVYACRRSNDVEAEAEAENAASSRRVLKADREKLRRDKLNEQFLDLGNLLGKPMLVYFLG